MNDGRMANSVEDEAELNNLGDGNKSSDDRGKRNLEGADEEVTGKGRMKNFLGKNGAK